MNENLQYLVRQISRFKSIKESIQVFIKTCHFDCKKYLCCLCYKCIWEEQLASYCTQWPLVILHHQRHFWVGNVWPKHHLHAFGTSIFHHNCMFYFDHMFMLIRHEAACKPDLNKRYLAFCLVGPKDTVCHEPHKININGVTISV